MDNQRTLVALLYDFDKTLTTRDMQEYTFIPSLGLTATEFWNAADELANGARMDRILAYMKLMVDICATQGRPLKKSDLENLGKDLEFYPGVQAWFKAINSQASSMGVDIEHYIISSGLKEIIEGSAIGGEFTRIYASEYWHAPDGQAQWPRLAVNYTGKTQFLFRVNKGVLDVSEDNRLNEHTPQDDRRIPFRNMVYIGDGMTDVPCMKLVKTNGGTSIAVHGESGPELCNTLMRENRIDHFARADYRPGSDLWMLLCAVLEGIRAKDLLARRHKREMDQALESSTNR